MSSALEVKSRISNDSGSILRVSPLENRYIDMYYSNTSNDLYGDTGDELYYVSENRELKMDISQIQSMIYESENPLIAGGSAIIDALIKMGYHINKNQNIEVKRITTSDVILYYTDLNTYEHYPYPKDILSDSGFTTTFLDIRCNTSKIDLLKSNRSTEKITRFDIFTEDNSVLIKNITPDEMEDYVFYSNGSVIYMAGIGENRIGIYAMAQVTNVYGDMDTLFNKLYDSNISNSRVKFFNVTIKGVFDQGSYVAIFNNERIEFIRLGDINSHQDRLIGTINNNHTESSIIAVNVQDDYISTYLKYGDFTVNVNLSGINSDITVDGILVPMVAFIMNDAYDVSNFTRDINCKINQIISTMDTKVSVSEFDKFKDQIYTVLRDQSKQNVININDDNNADEYHNDMKNDHNNTNTQVSIRRSRSADINEYRNRESRNAVKFRNLVGIILSVIVPLLFALIFPKLLILLD